MRIVLKYSTMVYFRMDGLSARKNGDAYVFELESVNLHELKDISIKYVRDDDLADG